MGQNSLSLYELNMLVKQTLKSGLPNAYWIQAELSDVRFNSTGHCYLEFIQKDNRTTNLIAKARGTIWANVFKILRSDFEETTGQAFVSGIKVMVQVTVEYHELFGLSLTVIDIDSTYTLGDMARKRREILSQLEQEGVLTLNKELEMHNLVQKIAVISSITAAGYGDFCMQLKENPYGFIFYPHLFPALMQGSQVEDSIVGALNRINEHRDEFDVVVIIRGGGATSDLSGFDTYFLAANCAQFPIPIITGIGHERDDTVIDEVAHTRVKTPTAAAQFLINRMCNIATQLTEITEKLPVSVHRRMENESLKLNKLIEYLPVNVANKVKMERYFLTRETQKMSVGIDKLMTRQKHLLLLLEQQISNFSPEKLLKRGYSMTLKNGKIVKDPKSLIAGDIITTRLAKGEIQSEVK